MSKKMHVHEVDTNPDLVQSLLKKQFPQWADLPLKAVRSAGTDNAIYRLGDTMSVRLPRIDWATGQIEKEQEWLAHLAPQLPLSVPDPLAVGKPDESYPWQWAIYKWLEGENKTLEQLNDPNQVALDLAAFLKALQAIDTTNTLPAAEHNQRGLPLLVRDTVTRRCISELEGIIDTDLALALWEHALDASQWHREPVWIHGDLLVGNLLFNQQGLTAVIDFGGLAVGDPACDLMVAWSLLGKESREVLRKALNVDDATWLRGQGHALSQAVMFIPYYLDTNPIGVAYAKRMISELLGAFQDRYLK